MTFQNDDAPGTPAILTPEVQQVVWFLGALVRASRSWVRPQPRDSLRSREGGTSTVWSRMQDSNPRRLFTRQVLCPLS